MKIFDKVKGMLGAFGEWASVMAPVVGLFLFAHHENVHVNDRLDQHMIEINKRADMINQRADVLHQEFIDLLKEMRK